MMVYQRSGLFEVKYDIIIWYFTVAKPLWSIGNKTSLIYWTGVYKIKLNILYN